MNKPQLLQWIAAGIVLAGAAAVAHAGPIQDRMDHQRARIAQGVQSGRLTPWEAHRLRAGERHIAMERARFAANDGRLGPWERARLHRDLNVESRRIYRMKHDCRVRG